MRRILIVGNWNMAASPYEDNLWFSSSRRARSESDARAALFLRQKETRVCEEF
jgi:hypothetical protein